VRAALPAELADRAVFDQRTVEYSFLELAQHRTMLERRVFRIQGVVSVDLKETVNRVEVGVAIPSAAQEVLGLAKDLNIPDGMVITADMPYPRAASMAVRSAPNTVSHSLLGSPTNSRVTSGYRLSVAGVPPCTIGVTAIRKSTLDSVFTTASHCTPVSPGGTGANAGQPGYSPTVGIEVWDRGLYFCSTIQVGPCRRSDASLFRENSSNRTIDLGKIARTINSSGCENCIMSRNLDHSNPTYTVTGRRDYAISNEILHKVGTSTGHTYGAVEATCTTVSLLTWNKVCTDRIDYSSEPGDSGAPVFKLTGSSATLIGVHWGYWPWPLADGLASRISGIEADMGGDLAVFDPGGPVASISGPSVVKTGLLCTWTGVVSNGLDPFIYSWTGLWTGSSGSIAKVASSSGWLYFNVTDLLGRVSTYSKYVTVSPGGPTPPECSE